MSELNKTIQDRWAPVNKSDLDKEKISRPSLTYWQDAWRRLKQNALSMIGLATVIILVLLAVFGPMLTTHSYDDMDLSLANLPPRLTLHQISEDRFVYVHKEYLLYEFKGNGEVVGKLDPTDDNIFEFYRAYEMDGKEVKLDFALARKTKDDPNAKKFIVSVDGKEVETTKKVFNKRFKFGTDSHGRDLFVRVLDGARISLTVAFIASLVNLLVGVIYGGISGYVGGRVDNVMMRIVDVISTIPLMLYVILISVVIGKTGMFTIIITMGLTYWVRMARLVRGQALSIKEQEFVLAARTLGASTWRIMLKHVVPNALGPIIVAMTMQIPSAIFTESFLSFIGLGVSAPKASWGTLASTALPGIRSYAYQLLFPAGAITITMLAFNFLGDGLRDALDPRLRK